MGQNANVVSRYRALVLILALAISGCQTVEEFPSTNAWGLGRPISTDQNANLVPASHRIQGPAPERSESASILQGTGKFFGEPGSLSPHTRGDDIETITVNLVAVPVAQAAKTILNDILGVKYTLDPAVDGKITIQTPRPVTKSAAADLFEAALRSNNAAIINAGDIFKIVPTDQAAVGASIRLDGTPSAGEQLGSRVQIVQLKYVAASEIRRILEPISPRGGIVQTDSVRNAITLSGSSQEIAGMLEAISIFDIDVMKGMSFAFVPIKTSQPDVIVDQLRTVFSADREGPMAGMVRFIPNRQLSAVLIVSPQPEYLTRAAEWARRFDARAEGSEKQFFTYTVQNRRAQEVVDVLQSMFSSETGGNRTSGPTRNITPQHREASVQSTAASPTTQSPTSPGGSSRVGAAFAQMSTGQASMPPARMQQAASTVASEPTSPTQSMGSDASLEPRIKIAIDEGKNAILIQATPIDYRRVLRVLNSLDVMPTQVLIEATIAEISLNDRLKFGLRWYLNKNNASYTFTDALSGAISSVFPGFSYALQLSNIGVTLNALNEITDVNVISSPTLTAMDNKTAVLQIGDQVPITTQSAVSVLTPGAPIVNSINYKDTGVILSMTPRINSSGRILLDLEQEVSTVAPTVTSGIDSPTIRQRRIKTSVVINNGESLALGGLIQDSANVSRTQIPVLGDIPLLGNAFKKKDNLVDKKELIIIITPYLMRNVSEARQVTDEFRRELTTYVPPHVRQWRGIGQTLQRTLE